MDAHRRGERPDPAQAIHAAPEAEREVLGAMIAAYLAAHPETDVAEDVVAARAALPASDPPVAWPELLPALRAQTHTTRGTLVTQLAADLGFPDDTHQVEEHVHHLETGQLSPAGVSPSVVKALAKILGVTTALLEAGQQLSTAGAQALPESEIYFREAPAGVRAQEPRRIEEPTRNPLVDALFGVERG